VIPTPRQARLRKAKSVAAEAMQIQSRSRRPDVPVRAVKKLVQNETECAYASDGTSQRGKLKPVSAPRIYLDRRPVKGEVVTVIDVTFDSSGIDLVDAWSRAVPRGEVHEIMIWSPFEEGDDAAAVAFIEVTQGGNIVNGDEVRLDGETIGNLVGFDYNHMPNHMNIVVEARSLNLQVKLGSVFEFVQNPMLSIVEEKCC
jgi:hypothetical protein